MYVILAHVMPVVALLHLVFQYFMLEELMDGINRDWVADFNEVLVSFANADLSSVASSVIAGVTNASAALVQSTEAVVQTVGNTFQSTSDVKLMTSSFDVDHNHGDDAMFLVNWSIYVNAPIIIFFLLNKWRKQFGLPSLADKLQASSSYKRAALLLSCFTFAFRDHNLSHACELLPRTPQRGHAKKRSLTRL